VAAVTDNWLATTNWWHRCGYDTHSHYKLVASVWIRHP